MLRNSTIKRDLQTCIFMKSINHLAKEIYKNIYNFPNAIFTETPDYQASETSYKKSPRYSLIIDDES